MADEEYESDEYEDDSEPEGESEEWAPSRDEWEKMHQFQEKALPVLQQLSSFMNEPLMPGGGQPQEYGQFQPQEQEEEFDPYDPDSVQNYIQRNIQAGVENALGPFQGILGTVAAREGESLARGELDRIKEESGAFDQDTAFLVASGLIESGSEPTVALERAASYARDLEARIRADEREKYKTELEQLATAPQERPTGSASAVDGVPVPTGPDRYRVAVERALGNNHPVIPG